MYIPAPVSNWSDWISTDPGKIKNDLVAKHSYNNYLIRDLVIILKYWNVKNGKVYTSYELENYIVNKWFFSCTNIKDYFFSAVEGLPTSGLPSYKKSKVDSLKTKIQSARFYETNNMQSSALNEIVKALS